MWAAYRQLTDHKNKTKVVGGITAKSLNQHYAAITPNISYQLPLCKHSEHH